MDLSEIPWAISSEYTQEPNTNFIVYEGAMVIRLDNIEVTCSVGIIVFSWLPTPRLRFSIDLSIEECALFWNKEITLEFQGEKAIAKSYKVTNNLTTLQGSVIKYIVKKDIKLNKVVFYISNFPEINGENPIRDQHSVDLMGRLILNYSYWEIKIDALKYDKKRISKLLKDSSGYAITYVATLQKSNKDLFSQDEASIVLEALHYYLSFLVGSWVSPILPTGYTASDEVIFLQTVHYKTTSFKQVSSWFPFSRTEALSSLFSEFMKLWDNPDWNESLRILISLYVESNHPKFVEQSLLLVQSAFELLAWLVFVQKEKVVTSNNQWKQKSNNTKKMLRELFLYFKIPCEIPASVDGFYTFTLEQLIREDSEAYKECTDAPSTVVEIRNRIIHPRKIAGYDSIFKFSEETRVQAAFLSSWQLEMCLLNLFKYQGVYSNRLKLGRYDGDYDDLPWNSNT